MAHWPTVSRGCPARFDVTGRRVGGLETNRAFFLRPTGVPARRPCRHREPQPSRALPALLARHGPPAHRFPLRKVRLGFRSIILSLLLNSVIR